MTSLIRALATHSVPVRQRLFSRGVCGGGKLGVAHSSWKFCCLNVEVEKIPERESKRWGDSERGQRQQTTSVQFDGSTLVSVDLMPQILAVFHCCQQVA